MEERALGGACTLDDAVEAATLKAVAIELGKSGFEDLAASGLGGFGLGDFCGGFLHHATTIQTSRYVCQEESEDFLVELVIASKCLILQ
jgi:hypothetical protein